MQVIQDLKEILVDGDISSYQWILTGLMWVDALTKEIEMHRNMKKLLKYRNFESKNKGIDKVQFINGEIWMSNITIRDRKDQL